MEHPVHHILSDFYALKVSKIHKKNFKINRNLCQIVKMPEPEPPGSGQGGRGPRSLHRGARFLVRESGTARGQRAQRPEEIVQEAATGTNCIKIGLPGKRILRKR